MTITGQVEKGEENGGNGKRGKRKSRINRLRDTKGGRAYHRSHA